MIKFYLILIVEIILYPFLILIEEVKKLGFITNKSTEKNSISREPANPNKILVCVHDWAGYDLKRTKGFKNGKIIECGLQYQVNRFRNYTGKKEVDLVVTISDIEKAGKNKYKGIKVQAVSNVGFDFSGYSHFVDHLPDENCYLLLMNSSVEKSDVDFIDDYINFMQATPNIGMLGISFSTKMYQTFIKNNFIPHLQSFFLLTTTSVLKDVIKYNSKFPGKNISNKRLLIREGEIKISNIVEKLGYSLAIITENGKPFTLPKSTSAFFNNYKRWKMPYGDYRYSVETPNKINKLNQDQNIFNNN